MPGPVPPLCDPEPPHALTEAFREIDAGKYDLIIRRDSETAEDGGTQVTLRNPRNNAVVMFYGPLEPTLVRAYKAIQP